MGRFLQELSGFLRSLFGPALGSLRGNASLAFLSVTLAFALWIFVTDTENPLRSDVLPFDIAVEGVNPAADVAIAGPIPPVRVRVEAPEDIWESLTVDDFQAAADLFGLREGTHEVEVRVITERSRVTITRVIPNTVEVVLKPLFSKSVPVTVEVVGAPPAGYQMGTPLPEVNTVLASGPEDLLTLVGQAVARVDVTGLTADVVQAFRLQASDALGRRVEGVELEPSLMNVRIPIRQVQFSRLLPVSPVLLGSPAVGYNVTGVSVEPAAVTALGSQEALGNLSVLRTKPIDIEGATVAVLTTVALDLPAGVTVSGNSDVTATVQILPALGQATFQVTPTVTNLAPGLRLTSGLPPVQVVLSGELPVLLSLRLEDISAVLDLVGLGSGSHTVAVGVGAPPGLAVASVTPAEVQVVLEA